MGADAPHAKLDSIRYDMDNTLDSKDRAKNIVDKILSTMDKMISS
jgi:hypothetical protein